MSLEHRRKLKISDKIHAVTERRYKRRTAPVVRIELIVLLQCKMVWRSGCVGSANVRHVLQCPSSTHVCLSCCGWTLCGDWHYIYLGLCHGASWLCQCTSQQEACSPICRVVQNDLGTLVTVHHTAWMVRGVGVDLCAWKKQCFVSNLRLTCFKFTNVQYLTEMPVKILFILKLDFISILHIQVNVMWCDFIYKR